MESSLIGAKVPPSEDCGSVAVSCLFLSLSSRCPEDD